MHLQVITKRVYILDMLVSNKNCKFQYYMEGIFSGWYSGHFIPNDKVSFVHWTKSNVVHRAALDEVKRGIIKIPTGTLNPVYPPSVTLEN